jgi:hypothetical protein
VRTYADTYEAPGSIRLTRLLVGVSDSAASWAAVAAAGELARRAHACLTLVTVVPCPPLWEFSQFDDAGRLHHSLDQDGDRLLRDASKRIPEDVGIALQLVRHYGELA